MKRTSTIWGIALSTMGVVLLVVMPGLDLAGGGVSRQSVAGSVAEEGIMGRTRRDCPGDGKCNPFLFA